MNEIIKRERRINLFGIDALAHNVVADTATGRIRNQEIGAVRYYKQGGREYRIAVELRFDDQYNNGRETFAITGSIDEKSGRGYSEFSGGCIHDDIKKRFPELAHLIRWHLVSTDGPMHYLANTLYHAGDRDHNGLRKGEARQLRNGKTGLPCWELKPVGQKPEKYVDSETQPAAPQFEYVPWLRVGEGKKRELDHARSSAVWPDATDAELCAEPEVLKAALIARLPSLLTAFKADMLACGFTWPGLPMVAA